MWIVIGALQVQATKFLDGEFIEGPGGWIFKFGRGKQWMEGGRES